MPTSYETPRSGSGFGEVGDPRRAARRRRCTGGRAARGTRLKGDEFAPYRPELESLFDRRAITRDTSAEEYLRIKELIDAMQDVLKSRIRELPLTDYAAAKRFLKSVAHEAGQQVGPIPGVATDF